MKNVLRKTAGIIMAAAMIGTQLVMTASAEDTAAERITAATVVGNNGWCNGSVSTRAWDNVKGTGVYLEASGDGEKKSKATEGAAVSADNPELGDGVKFDITTAYNNNYSMKFFAVGKKKILIPYYANNAYFEFELYSTEDFSMPKIYMGCHSLSGGWPGVTYKTEQSFTANKWNKVSIPLSDLPVSSGWNNLDFIDNIRFYLPELIEKDFSVYFRAVRITYEPIVNLSVDVSGAPQASLSWTAYAGNITGYNVYRNNVPIAENITETSYIDDGCIPGGAYTYRVESYNDTAMIAYGEKTAVVHPAFQVVKAEVINTDGTINAGIAGSKGLKYYNDWNYSLGSVISADGVIPAGSRMWEMKAKGEGKPEVAGVNKAEKLFFEWGNSNLKNFSADSYIELAIYIEAADTAVIHAPSSVRLTRAGDWKTFNFAMPELKRNEWNYISLPIGQNLESIYDTQINFDPDSESATESYKLYIKDFRIVEKPSVTADAEFVSVGDVVNFTTNVSGAELIIASYDADNVLKNIVVSSETAAAHTAADGEFSIKAMLWKNTDGMYPVCSFAEVSVY